MHIECDAVNFLNQLSAKIEWLTEFTGQMASWLVLALALLVNYDVAMRYFFMSGSIAIQEMEWHLFALIFLLGAAYTLKHDHHVRLDIFYKNTFSVNTQAWINIFGSIFLLFPFCIFIVITAWQFTLQSYIHLEGSPDPGGLPYRWIIKASIVVGFILLLLQGLSDVIKNLNFLLKKS